MELKEDRRDVTSDTFSQISKMSKQNHLTQNCKQSVTENIILLFNAVLLQKYIVNIQRTTVHKLNKLLQTVKAYNPGTKYVSKKGQIRL